MRRLAPITRRGMMDGPRVRVLGDGRLPDGVGQCPPRSLAARAGECHLEDLGWAVVLASILFCLAKAVHRTRRPVGEMRLTCVHEVLCVRGAIPTFALPYRLRQEVVAEPRGVLHQPP